MKKVYLYLSVLITVIIISGCENLYNDAYDSANPNVYVAGYERVSTPYRNAIYWKNDEMHRLTNASADNVSIANSIFVYKGKAYIAGVEYGNAFYSIDGGEFNYQPDGVEANSVFVNNNDVYIAGSKYDASVFYPMLWKNSTTVTLPLALQVVAKSVFVLNEDVYMTGADITGSYIATYWLKGIRTNLSGSLSTTGNSIFVYDGNFYIAGIVNSNYACYWKNAGTVNQLSVIQSAAYSIFVYKGDVYVAGLVNNGSFDQAVYWKNGELVYLSQIKSASNSIFVYNEDIYVAGWEEIGGKEIAKYWKNGESVTLYNGAYHSRSTSIFVSDE